MKNADEAELQLLASQPLDITVHNVQDFPQLGTLAGLLGRLICQKVQGGSRDPGEQHPRWPRPRLAALGKGMGPLYGAPRTHPRLGSRGRGACGLGNLWGPPGERVQRGRRPPSGL